MFDRIEFLIGEALVALRRNRWMTFSAISTVCVALYLLGGLALAYFSLTSYAATLPGRFTIEVFLKEGTTREQISQISAQIKTLPGVESSVWISREEFWKQQKAKLPPDVTAGIENPLPDKFRIQLEEVDKADEVANAIKKVDRVEEVAYLAQEQRVIASALRLIRTLGLTLGGLMLVTAGVLIFNAIRLTIVARRREIRIMTLVGASRPTITIPLLLEGVIQGALGGGIAALLLWSSHVGLARLIEGLDLLGRFGPFPVGAAMAWLATIGGLYGLICSFMAAKEAKFEA